MATTTTAAVFSETIASHLHIVPSGPLARFASDLRIDDRTYACAHSGKYGIETKWWRQDVDQDFVELHGWFFSKHKEQPEKDGQAYFPGKLAEPEKAGCTANNVEWIDLIGIDIDVTSEDEAVAVLNTLKAAGLGFAWYSTFTHLSTETESADYRDWAWKNSLVDKADQTARRYLAEVKGYPPAVVEGARVKLLTKPSARGVVTVLEHGALIKLRIVLALDKSYKPIEMSERYGVSDKDARTRVWNAALKKFLEAAGVPFDVACAKDVSRRFYRAACPKGFPLEDLIEGLHPGTCVSLESILPADVVELDALVPPLKQRSKGTSRTAHKSSERAPVVEWEGLNLTKWKAMCGKTWDGESVLRDSEAYKSDRPDGGIFVRCPTDGHSDGEHQTFFRNGDDERGFTFYCSGQTDDCVNKDPLERFAGLLDKGWVTPDDLENSELGGGPVPKVGVGATGQSDGRPFIANWNFDGKGSFVDTCNRILDLALARNKEDPRLFVLGDKLVRLRFDPLLGQTVAQALTQAALRQEIDAVVDFFIVIDGKPTKKHACPKDIAENLFNRPSHAFPLLKAIVDTPFFDAEWNLVTTPGYHEASQTYYQPPDGWRMPEVPRAPSDYEVRFATWLLSQPLVNIPFDDDDAAANGEASKANWLAKLMQSFLHAPINAATPWYGVRKPKERTGATLLENVHALIAYGHEAQAQTEKASEEEIQKVVAAELHAGSRHLFFDNLHNKLDSATLAALGTGTIYKARKLGCSEMIVAPVRCEKVFNGNNVRLSDEMRERTCLINLDAHMPTPADRTEFKYPELLATVKTWRHVLVWACLTLIQSWVAAGRPKWKGRPMGGFERCCGTLGGILEHASIPGYLANRKLLREALGDDNGDDQAFIEAWWRRFNDNQVGVGTLKYEADGKTADNLCELALLVSHRVQFAFAAKPFSGWHIEVGKLLAKLKGQTFALRNGVCVRVHRDRVTRKWLLSRDGVRGVREG